MIQLGWSRDSVYHVFDYLYMVKDFSWWSNLDDHEIPFTMYLITYNMVNDFSCSSKLDGHEIPFTMYRITYTW